MKFSKKLDLRFFQYLKMLRFAVAFRQYRSAVTFADVPPSPSADAAPFVIFTAADSRYLRRFLYSYCASVMAHVSSPRLHVHLYNAEEQDLQFMAATRNDFPGLALSWSLERFDQEALERRAPSSNQQSWKSLYICTSRFIAADELQKRTGVALFITDIDILFYGDVTKRFSGEIDISLMLRPEERNICKRTLGGVVYVSARAPGRSFLIRAARDNARFLRAGFYWFAFDQLALYRAYKAMSQRARAAHFSPLTEHDISFEMEGNGLILFPKGKIKDQYKFAEVVKTFIKTPEQE